VNAVFEGSYLGDASKLDDATALECGICWHVYDPAVGDDVAQIPPGTPFAALPETWRCPNCDAPKQKFMVLGAAGGAAASPDVVQQAIGAYRRIAAAMSGLPIYNPQLIVEAVGFRDHNGRPTGVVVTPWFMNLTVLPGASEPKPWQAGNSLRFVFPSGEYEFHVGELEGVGLVASCSLFSPMNDFADHEAARLAATAAIDALFEPDPEVAAAAAAEAAAAPAAAAPALVSRRGLLGVTG
jgi:[NiFe] hydrogenase assembly HybE family chaperone